MRPQRRHQALGEGEVENACFAGRSCYRVKCPSPRCGARRRSSRRSARNGDPQGRVLQRPRPREAGGDARQRTAGMRRAFSCSGSSGLPRPKGLSRVRPGSGESGDLGALGDDQRHPRRLARRATRHARARDHARGRRGAAATAGHAWPVTPPARRDRPARTTPRPWCGRGRRPARSRRGARTRAVRRSRRQ